MRISDAILKNEIPASRKIGRQVHIYKFLSDPPPYPVGYRWLYSDQIEKQENEWRRGSDRVLVRDPLTQEIFPVQASRLKYKVTGEKGKEEAVFFVEREGM